MKILYFGVFDGRGWRSEYPMAAALTQQGHQIYRSNFRSPLPWRIAWDWRRYGSRCDLVFVQNGIPFSDRNLVLLQAKPLVFLASEFALTSARHILDGPRRPDLVLAHSEQTFRYCQAQGILARRVHLAYNPSQYRHLELPFLYDVCFIGGMTPRRREFVEHLRAQGYQVYFEKTGNATKINRVYNQSRIVLHIHAGEESYVPTRLFEVMSTQGCLLIEDMGHNFDAALGQDFFESFSTKSELVDQVARLLADSDLRIQRVQRANALAPVHSWPARMREYAESFALVL
ncbi:MAG: hypothetical protein CVV27_14830 [Candidatus Melainabacteria bacterium HGW-Melainabacteria-1]|nr:MAG: hypothetical protein CVV27_14830 [Candidatus Melainabacteria bacterium HGW-Melainabacteria-1]